MANVSLGTLRDYMANKPVTATMQNAATGTNNGTDLSVAGYGVALLQVTGTFVATITVRGSLDGNNFADILCEEIITGARSTTITAPGVYRVNCLGFQKLRAAITSYTSGSVTVYGVAEPFSVFTGNIQLTGSSVVDGGSLPAFVIPIAASDGTKVRFLYASPDRRLEVWNKRFDYITFEHDSIDVARMSKGPVSVPFDAVTTGGTSQEIFCGGFNAMLVHHVISGGSTGGYVSLQMSPKSLGTFVAHHGKGQNIKSAATANSYISLYEAIFDYVKLVLTVTDGTHTVIAQPINL